ncbi:cobalamin biosynthesis protein CbiG [Desulfolutivibrio sulfoxidireducens]|nr:cobalamin biosynthesis protein CbiG [Desulfolutivibrio sulfoxidireducens]
MNVFWGGEVQEGNPFCSQKGFPSWSASSSPGSPPSIAVHTLTASSEAVRVCRELGGVLYAPDRFASAVGAEGFGSFVEHVARVWGAYRGHVFFAACGAVVRAIAPLVRDKATDPAVVVADPAGRFVVSVLSGHLGGANELARVVAAVTGGQAVITTATDAVGAPAAEVLAARCGLGVENRAALARVNAVLAEGGTVPVFDPDNRWVIEESGLARFFEWVSDPGVIEAGRPHIVVDVREMGNVAGRLVLRPRVLAVGVGCRRGTSGEEIAAAVRGVLAERGFAAACVGVLASVEVKRDEAGIAWAARECGVGVRYFSARALDAVDVPSPSRTVKLRVGTASVCEAAAMLAAGTNRLVVNKRVVGPVTVAVAMAG